MAKRILAGYDPNKLEHREVLESYKSQGDSVVTYNQRPGLADSTNLESIAHGSSEIVNMSKNDPSNDAFHNKICKAAGNVGATVSRRHGA